ncbi:MAG: M81 family metallopeptidase [Opitutaceae bacterium]|nr:M81 family metallopeptidase [Opitutaceae bacterium]
MPRILIAECKQEVSTFNPHLSRHDSFAVRSGEALLRYHRTVRNEVGGALRVLDSRPNAEVIPSLSAFSITSGGPLAGADWRRLSSEIVHAIRNGGEVDGVYFCMHGAMAAEGEEDPEGWLLAETRRLVGARIPLVVSMDLHGIPTDRMFEHADAIVAFHTYPHVDFFSTGERSARLLLRLLDGGVRPVTAKVAIPALVRGEELITATGAFGKCTRRAAEIEAESGGLSAAMFIGNPFTDVPELQTYACVTTDGDPARAEREALALADEFWGHHERMEVPLVSLQEMTRIAATASATVGLVDAADATSSGASGDGNAIVRALAAAGHVRTVLAPVVDAPAVQAAFAAGVGATITVPIGGTLDSGRFSPLERTGRVMLLADRPFRSESFGEEWYAGPTAVLESEPFTFVLSSRAVNLYDRSFFWAHGQDPRHFDAVVIKSPYCQHHMYAGWVSRMVDVDAPGATSANLRILGHRRCVRPIFPLDSDVRFERRVRIFDRHRQRAT